MTNCKYTDIYNIILRDFQPVNLFTEYLKHRLRFQ